MYGGGFRQAGIIAAGALYALKNHRERLVEDHTHAARLAAGLAEMPGISLEADLVETNIVYFDVAPMKAADFCTALHDAGVAMLPLGATRVRAVTHLEISSGDIDRALTAVTKALHR